MDNRKIAAELLKLAREITSAGLPKRNTPQKGLVVYKDKTRRENGKISISYQVYLDGKPSKIAYLDLDDVKHDYPMFDPQKHLKPGLQDWT